jgi:hypothetical protein
MRLKTSSTDYIVRVSYSHPRTSHESMINIANGYEKETLFPRFETKKCIRLEETTTST